MDGEQSWQEEWRKSRDLVNLKNAVDGWGLMMCGQRGQMVYRVTVWGRYGQGRRSQEFYTSRSTKIFHW